MKRTSHRSVALDLVVLLVLVASLLTGCGMASLPSAPAAAAATSVSQASDLGTTGMSILGPPSISSDFINKVLAAYHSPASGLGQSLYDDGVHFHIDPAFALAFFFHESAFGTRGEAQYSKSLGNLRCIDGYACRDGYAWFPSWQDGFYAWYSLLSSSLYIGDHLTTIEQIIPRYAPAGDNNDEQAYCQAVESAVKVWRSGQVEL